MNVMHLYGSQGFLVQMVYADSEFKPLQGLLTHAGSGLNVCSNDEHVPEVECFIRMIKEHTHCLYHSVPFTHFPSIMLKEMVMASVFWLNMFLLHDGISDMVSPQALLMGFDLDYHKHCHLQFGAYIQTHEEHDNSMQSHTTGAIALCPTGNHQGGYYFMSLISGHWLIHNHWMELPLPQDVINCINALSHQSQAQHDFSFAWRHGSLIIDLDAPDDDPVDPDYAPSDSESDADDDLSFVSDGDLPAAGVDDIDINHDNDINTDDTDDAHDANDANDMASPPDQLDYTDVGGPFEQLAVDNNKPEQQAIVAPNEHEAELENNVDHVKHAEVDDIDHAKNTGVAPTDHAKNTGVGPIPEVEDMDSDNEEETGKDEMAQKYGERWHGHDLWPHKPHDYSHLYSDLEHTMFMQYNVKKGLKLFSKAGTSAMVAEMQQLHDHGVIVPKHTNMLTHEEKWQSLKYLILLKQKHCGWIKGCGCVDGWKQCIYKTKEETSAPTMSLESLFLSCIIDAKEGQKVATCDIPGAFMQADIIEIIHVKLEGPLAMFLTRVDSMKYSKFITTKNGKEVIYVWLAKALYGMLQAAYLFWKDLSGYLIKQGFELNPYDNCMANKQIDGLQCTVLWHVDDMKISHMKDAVLDDMITDLNEWYGKITPLTVTQGLIHEYLGMTLNYSVPGKFTIRMDDYMQGILNEAPADMDGAMLTPAAQHLFEVDNAAKCLPPEKAELFHHLMAKLLFLCKCAWPGLQTTIAFLTTRVKQPDTNDYKKLTHTICYLHGTPDLVAPTLKADNAHVVKWWVNASFTVHPDMHSHTGGMMSLSKGSTYSTLTHHKINIKSSTEAKLVAVDDVMPMIF